MSFIAFLIILMIGGLFVGALARFALPGRDPLTIPQTILLGVVGSLAAGLVTYAIFDRKGGSIFLSVAFSTLIMYFIRRSRGGSLTDPGRVDDRNS
jgi:uncharacterized membrane protein YeaQ/YmgE (transglycosylase-associated protein family)